LGTSPPSDLRGESQHQCRETTWGREEDWEEELEMETREGIEEGAPPEETGESMLTLSPSSLAQTTLSLATRAEGGGW
jgi:hypothetical protein